MFFITQLSLLGVVHLGRAQVDHFGKCHGDHTQVNICDAGACPEESCIDCAWGPWSDWGPCTCEGIMDRHRVILNANSLCGKPCVGPKVETKKCEPDCQMASKDCELSEWSDWSKCDKTCDGGQKFRERTVIQNLAAGGATCDGNLKETAACHMSSCGNKQECVLGPWSAWTKCTKSCNAGQQERERSVATPAADGGMPCDDVIIQLRGCNLVSCSDQIDCKWGQWVDWSACSRTCGGGEKSRSRLIEIAPREGGKLCDPHSMSEVSPCNTDSCTKIQDCEFAGWSGWSDCSCSCKGTQARTRHINVYSEEGGTPCTGSLKMVQPCNVDKCGGPEGAASELSNLTDCVMEAFGEWSRCSTSCGNGQASRSRDILTPAKNGGNPCEGALNEVKGCVGAPCTSNAPAVEVEEPIDCLWGDWSDWGACSASCNGGLKQHQRSVKQMANHSGKPCEPKDSIKVEPCNTEGCGCKDCEWGEWGDWGACTCTGLRERHRSIIIHYASCGKPCDGAKATTTSCVPDCQEGLVDCKLSDWSDWDKCSKSCGGGQKIRTRRVMVQSANGGKTCDGDLRQVDPCNQGHCSMSHDCSLSDWDEWSKCSATCGGGQQFRHRSISTPPDHMGKGCEDDLAEIRGCGATSCGNTVDCEWDDWTEWGACSASCGNGQKSRDRSIKVAPRSGGTLCAAKSKSEVAPCKDQECGNGCVDAEWGGWNDFGLCSASCGRGYKSRYRVVAHGANHCGKAIAGDMQQYMECNDIPCDVSMTNCDFGPWSNFGDCSCSCNGVRDRSRQITMYATNLGKTCMGPLKEVEPCNVAVCQSLHKPENCVMGEWSSWSNCSAKCGGGLQERSRIITSPPRNGGNPCEGSLKEVNECNYIPCNQAIDCKWGEWAEWDTCSADCGGGQRTRYRHIIIMPTHGGKSCEKRANVHVEGCNNQPCGKMLYCSWTEWAVWTDCSATCGHGESTRQRHMQKSTEPPPEGVLDSGILAQMEDYDLKHNFSLDDLAVVFTCGMLFTSVVFVAGVSWSRRRRSTNQGHELLLQDPDTE
eukprot:GEMP01001837.1.p1 GENE.GEMP01001837.1~~GEMP01001837.1.p1  ORF type:complete len:1041 (+),score=169.21 GEMP01001837.1:528-3650(+)